MSSVTGGDQVIKNLSSLERAIVREIVSACEAVQSEVMNTAKRLVPVDTGHLQGSIQPGGIKITNDNVEATVVANAEYASFVEHGTRKMRAQPYLTPALLENTRTFQRAINAAVKRGVDNLR